MSTHLKPALLTEERIYVSGTIERVTYHNPDNGFCVLRVKAKGFRDIVTVVGQEDHAVDDARRHPEILGFRHAQRDRSGLW